jgi:predicted nucleotidyltransferase
VKKFAIIGTSSAGKTTKVHEIIWRLKMCGTLVDGVLQQDRRFSFDRQRLEDSKLAQYSFITNQIKTECDMALRPGVDVLVSDRSPLDFYAYYEWQYGYHESWWSMVRDFCQETFTKLYYVEPVKYENDGARLSEEGRDEADKVIRNCIARYNSEVKNSIFKIHRDDIYKDILSYLGKTLLEEDLAVIPKALGTDVLIGGSYAFNRAHKFSDVDVYVKGAQCIPQDTPFMQRYSSILKDVLGVHVEVRTVNEPVWEYLKTQGFKEFKC